MTRTSKYIRIAGLVYLLEAVIAPIRNFYIPSKLSNSAAASTAYIAHHSFLFRIGIVGDLFTGLLGLAVVLILYSVFVNVDKRQARLMVILGGFMITPIYFVNTINDAAVLILANGSSSILSNLQTEGLVQLFLGMHARGVLINEIFWGLWLFPFGLLMYKSGFLPKFLGVLAFINGVAYLIISFTGLLLPNHANALANVLLPALMGEVVIMLWFLIIGARERNPKTSEPQKVPLA